MQRACVLLLCACGFHSRAVDTVDSGPTPDTSVADASLDAPVDTPLTEVCWTIASSNVPFNLSACALVTVGTIDVAENISINTDTGESTPPGLRCAQLVSSNDDFCALVAGTIRIRPQRTLSAHGTKSLALFANALDIQGTVDVSSHTGSTLRGAGADPIGCSPPLAATGGGGGGGGTFGDAGGPGGHQGGTTATRGLQGGSISTNIFRGGCDGGRGGDGSAGSALGGAGGGSVWLAATTTLTLSATAAIKASGAGGAGGPAGNRGGGGGGSGGMIVIQSAAIVLDPAAVIYANGGHGGGGSQGSNPGEPGTDPIGPLSGGSGGSGGTTASGEGLGDGGPGYPNAPFNGHDGDASIPGGGGGGGGGGAGLIRVFSPTTIPANPNISPQAFRLLP